MLRRRNIRVDARTPEDWEDAKLSIQEFGNWVKNADTKTTVLTAALGVTATAVASRTDSIVRAYGAAETGLALLLTLPLILFSFSVFVTIRFIYLALMPRTKPSSPANRFSWSSMATRTEPPKSLATSAVMEEAWEHAHTLAGIADKKYKAFRWALIWYFLVFLFAALSIALPLAIGALNSAAARENAERLSETFASAARNNLVTESSGFPPTVGATI